MTDLSTARIAVLGLGYVGLPLAVEFAKHFDVLGFDINEQRVGQLNQGHDRTLEVSDEALKAAIQSNLEVSANADDLKAANVYVVTAPTPIDENKEPDLGPILAASRSIGAALKPGDTVIFESTVFPGATEERCVPVLEETSGLAFNEDFVVGYSPERINPGDKKNTLPNIIKVTSGSTPEAAEFIDSLYRQIITAGTHKAPSIRVAEAAKVIENTQRDVNIALINELAVLFNRLEIDTRDVLKAAGTKWNFLNFSPGLVGGHCIGVDPYYLTHKAKAVGYHPEIILAGRRLNDGMGSYVASEMVKLMANRGLPINGGRILMLGLTFKENTPDLRNTRVIDIIAELEDYGIDVNVYDPWADPAEAREHLGVELLEKPSVGSYDGVILAVAHEDFKNSIDMQELQKDEKSVLYDIKGVLPAENVDLRL
ncbi:nucleotide sugar dehydrogenase [Yaniella halotolerans]|uniref:nucleotide sugar dehydrogenase n=1 Tax=Yaniella halotolerans TaxID=225453 RepID=UPI0003B4D456|nr:nucleotide sugar dehydrogenase [Yaniella halotolerans]